MSMTLTRNASYINNLLFTKDNKVYCKEKITIEFPKWYEDKNLLEKSDVNYLYGVFSIISGDNYSVSIIPTLLTTIPIVIKEIDRDGVLYTQFVYGKGDCVILNTEVIKNDGLAYNFFDNFMINARVPWFIEYEDLVKVMDNLLKYAKSNLGSNYIANELVSSFICRKKSDKRVFHRQALKEDYSFVDLNNVYYSALSTVSRLGGNYFKESLTSALVQKESSPTKLENLVRV